LGITAPLGVGVASPSPAGDAASQVLSGVFAAVGPSPPINLRGPMNVAFWAAYTTALTTTFGTFAASVASAGAIAVGDAVDSVNVPPGTTWKTFAGTAGTLALPAVTLGGLISGSKIIGLAETAPLVGAAVSGPGVAAGTTVLSVDVPAIPSASGFGGKIGSVNLSAPPTAQPLRTDQQFFTFALTAQAIATGVDAAATFTGAEIVYIGKVQLERSFDGCATFIPCNLGTSGLLAQWAAGTPVSFAFGEPEKQVYYRLNCIALTPATGVALNYRLSTTGAAAESLAINQLS
jgi:hypothetical protein